MKITKKILASIIVIFVLLNVYWQYFYEQSIKEVNEKCTNVNKRKRIKYTPIAVYVFMCYINKKEMKKDRLLCKLLIADCPNLEVTGYQMEYLTHVYLSEREKDSLLLVYDAEIRNTKFTK